MGVKAKKRLGQHFLADENIAKKIVNSLNIDPDHPLLEIGPGMGVLSKYLLDQYEHLKLIEIDSESVEYLKEKYDAIIIEGDFLKKDLNSFFDQPFSIIGNFPYNISSQIFFKVLESRSNISEVVCMIQKEVAERICAKNGSKTYGILSVLLQTYFDIDYLFTVKPGVFIPPPKVNSAVIRLRNKKTAIDVDEKLFFRVVKQSFNQRRKTLRNSLKSLLPLGFDSEELKKRPEQLNFEEFIRLTKTLQPS